MGFIRPLVPWRLPFILQILVEHLVCTRHCFRSQGGSHEQDRLSLAPPNVELTVFIFSTF